MINLHVLQVISFKFINASYLSSIKICANLVFSLSSQFIKSYYDYLLTCKMNIENLVYAAFYDNSSCKSTFQSSSSVPGWRKGWEGQSGAGSPLSWLLFGQDTALVSCPVGARIWG